MEIPGDPITMWTPDLASADPFYRRMHFQTNDLTDLKFRERRKSPELYLAATTKGSDRRKTGVLYSKEKYAFQIHSAAPLRNVTRGDWNRARPITSARNDLLWEGIIGAADDKNVTYQNRTFLKVGKHLSAAVLSSNNRWIAVFSYNGEQHPERERPGDLTAPGITKHPTEGVLYVDVYDAQRAEKVLAISGQFHNDIPINWFLSAYFLEDRYFFINTGEPVSVIKQFLLCELPKSTSR